MTKKISDRSREFSNTALGILEKIKAKYPKCPSYEKLTEEERALLLRQINQAGNAVAATHYKGFSFYEDLVKESRNIDAHSTKDDPQTINGIFSRLYKFIDVAKTELRQNIGKMFSSNKSVRRFEKFGKAFSSEEKRKQFSDGIQSTFNEGDFKPNFENAKENALAKATQSVLTPANKDQKELLDFAKNEANLFESIQKEIIEWTEKTNKILEETNPFIEEALFIGKLNVSSVEDIRKNIGKLNSEYNSIDSVKKFKSNANFEFFTEKFKENQSTKKKPKPKDMISKDNEILARNLIKDLQQELDRRKTAWELDQIEKQRQELLKELYEKIEKFKKLTETLKSFTQDYGRLWDLTQGELQDNGFDILEKYGDLLQNDEGLKELAEMIGRHRDEEQKFHKELREKIVVETVYNPEPAFKGEIAGLTISDNLPDTLPSELGLYSNPKTKQIFKMKFAQKQLLSYAYTRNVEYQKSHSETEEVEVGEIVEHKGPMLICVDTSGSMNGTPERVAKTICFALAKKSLEEQRGCYLISFSTGIETMDLSTFNSTQGLTNLVKFLRMSFHGGTDATPALNESLRQIEKKDWKNADVLMISDFQMSDLGEDLTKRINAAKENKSRFFSLAVTNGGSNQVISCFNNNWIYDTRSSDSTSKLIRQLHEMQ